MKVCLINPPILENRKEGYEWQPNMFTVQHIGIGYIAAVLEENGHQTDIIECMAQNISGKALFEMLEAEKYDVIGLSAYFYNFINVIRFVDKIKKINPSPFVFLGGYLPTLCHDVVLNIVKGADCCVLGEGDATVLDLVQKISSGNEWREITGIAYRGEGEIIKTPPREGIKNLDLLPFPKRMIFSDIYVNLVSSRGCYGRCSFCGIREFYDNCEIYNVRYRSARNVADEIEEIYHKYKIKIIMLNDENFFEASKRRKKWLDEFYEILEEKKLDVKFRVQVRANDLINNSETVEKFKNIGFYYVYVGVESFVQRQLDFYKKDVTADQNIKAMKIIRELGLQAGIGFIMLDPFVTIDDILHNTKMIRETYCCEFAEEAERPFSMRGTLRLFPGTSVYETMKKNGLISQDDIENMLSPYLKYNFQSEKVSVYYSIIELWYDRIYPAYELFYLIIKAEKYNLTELSVLLRSKKLELMLADLDFIDELCGKVNSEEINLNNCTEFIDNWAAKIKPIYDEFANAKQLLKNYN